MLFSTGNWSVGLQQIIQQYYDAYGQNPETYFPPDPKNEQEHLRPVQDPPIMMIKRTHTLQGILVSLSP